MVKEAVFNGQEKETDPSYITAMTKAHFKDGVVSNALSFFSDKVAKIREMKEEREKMLVDIFDAAFNGEDLTYEEFKQRYLQVL